MFNSVEEIRTVIDICSTTVTSAVEEQAVTINEITCSMTESGSSVTEIVRNIASVADPADDNGKKSQQTKESSKTLEKLATRFF